MPILVLTTNITDHEVPSDFESKMCGEVAKMLHRPLNSITTILDTEKRVYKGDRSAPYCLLQLYAFNAFDGQHNPLYTQNLTEILKQNFDSLKGERIQIQYRNVDPEMCGDGA